MSIRDLFSNSLVINSFDFNAQITPAPGFEDGQTYPIDLAKSSTATFMLLALVDSALDSFTVNFQYSEDGIVWYDEVLDQELGNSIYVLPNSDGTGVSEVTEITEWPYLPGTSQAHVHMMVNLVNPANSSLSVTEQPDKLRTRYARVQLFNNGSAGLIHLSGFNIQTPLRNVPA